MVGHQVLVLSIGVRVPIPQLRNVMTQLGDRDEKGSLGDFPGSFP